MLVEVMMMMMMMMMEEVMVAKTTTTGYASDCLIDYWASNVNKSKKHIHIYLGEIYLKARRQLPVDCSVTKLTTTSTVATNNNQFHHLILSYNARPGNAIIEFCSLPWLSLSERRTMLVENGSEVGYQDINANEMNLRKINRNENNLNYFWRKNVTKDAVNQ